VLEACRVSKLENRVASGALQDASAYHSSANVLL
jgi:hypothetical protein